MNSASVNKHYSDEKYNLYKSRVMVYCVFLAIALIVSIFLCFNIVSKEVMTPINYSDKGSLDYRVYLKENEFYTEKFLPKGQSYVTSLIDYIDINYNYLFNIDDLANVKFDYKVTGELIIENNSNKKELLNKSYDITDIKSTELKNAGELAFNEKFQINYDEYNKLANQFRSSLGVDTNSYLKLHLNVKRDTTDESNYKLNNNSININEIIIPLSEKAIEINIDSKNNEYTDQVKFDEKYNVNYIDLIIIILLIGLSIIFIRIIIISFKKMRRKRSQYDKYVNKLLKEYDRLIIETRNLIDFDKYNVIKVLEFTELLDVRDNLKVPINYYCCEKHLRGIFYVKSDDDVYALFLDAEELEKDK